VLLVVPAVLSMISIRLLVIDDRPDDASADSSRGIDGWGAALSASAVVLLVLTINNPFGFAWLSIPVVLGAVATVGLLIGFVRWELRVDRPMLDLRMFAFPVFRYAVLVRVVGFVAGTTAMLLLPVYLLSARGVSSALAGVLISILAVGMGLSAQVSGRMYDRVGPRLPTIIGLCLQIGATLALAFSNETTPLPVIGAIAFLAGVGMALWNVPNNSAMLGATPPESFGVGGAFTNVTRTVGNVIGQALITAVVAGVMASQGFDIPLGELGDTVGAAASFIDGWKLAFLISAGLSAVTVLFAARLPNRSGSGL
ncbi:MAG: MFS transporter, partial [Acidimicrobiales bacterium]